MSLRSALPQIVEVKADIGLFNLRIIRDSSSLLF